MSPTPEHTPAGGPSRRIVASPWGWSALSFGSLVAIAVLLFLVYRLRGVLLVLVASVFVAYVLEPLVARLARVPLGSERFIGRKPAAGAVVLGSIGVFAFALYWVVPVLWTEMARLGGELPRFYQMVEQWFVSMADRRGMGLPPEVWSSVQAEWHRLLETGARGAAGLLPTVLGSLDDLLGIIVVPIGAFYILTDGGALTSGFVEGLPVRWRPMARLLLTEEDRSL